MVCSLQMVGQNWQMTLVAWSSGCDIVLSDTAGDAELATPPAECPIGHKIEPVHPQNFSRCLRLKAMDSGGKGLA